MQSHPCYNTTVKERLQGALFYFEGRRALLLPVNIASG